MPVAVNQLPVKVDGGGSPADAIGKALGIVNTVYGIKADSAKLDAYKAEFDKSTIANKQAQLGLDASSAQAARLADPESFDSTAERLKGGALLSTIKGANKNAANDPSFSALNDLINKTDDTGKHLYSGLQIKQALDADSPAMKGLVGLAGDALKGQATMNAAGMKNQTFADRNSIQVSKDYETTMKPYRALQEDISRVEGALGTKDKNGNPLITSQQLGDANAAIARIFSPNHMSDATVNRTEYESLPAKFAAAVQRLSTNPTDIGSRDLVNHIIDQAHHIGNVSNKNALQELDSLDSGYTGLSSTQAQKVAGSKSNFFKNRFSKTYSTIGEQSPDASGGSGPAVDSDLTKMNPQQLKEYIQTHGGK